MKFKHNRILPYIIKEIIIFYEISIFMVSQMKITSLFLFTTSKKQQKKLESHILFDLI